MAPELLQKLLQERLEHVRVAVTGDGYHYQVLVIGDHFEGWSAVKRQQWVYAAMRDEIQNGAVHAVSVKAYTSLQWREVSASSVDRDQVK